MKAFLSRIVALVLLLLSLTFVDASLEEICKKIRPVPYHDIPGYDFCVTSLQVVPRSRNANVQGLAIIAAKLAKDKYEKNFARSKKLLKRNWSESIKEPLRSCIRYYSYAVKEIKATIAEIQSLDIFEALVNLEDVVIATAKCKESWEESKEKPLLLKENDDAYKISSLALGITNLLVNESIDHIY